MKVSPPGREREGGKDRDKKVKRKAEKQIQTRREREGELNRKSTGADQNGDGNRHDAQFTVGQEELLGGLLLAAPTSVENADGGGQDHHQGEDYVVPWPEMALHCHG